MGSGGSSELNVQPVCASSGRYLLSRALCSSGVILEPESREAAPVSHVARSCAVLSETQISIVVIGGSGKSRQSRGGRFCKKYLGYEHSETGYRRNNLRHNQRNLRHTAIRAFKKKIEKNFFHHTKSSILKILSKSARTQIRLLGTPRDFLRSRTTILGG